METITGVLYPETAVWLEWLFWGLILGVPALLTLMCSLCTPFRECMVRSCKRCCGVGHFALLAPLDPRSRLLVIKTTIELAGEKNRRLQHLLQGTTSAPPHLWPPACSVPAASIALLKVTFSVRSCLTETCVVLAVSRRAKCADEQRGRQSAACQRPEAAPNNVGGQRPDGQVL